MDYDIIIHITHASTQASIVSDSIPHEVRNMQYVICSMESIVPGVKHKQGHLTISSATASNAQFALGHAFTYVFGHALEYTQAKLWLALTLPLAHFVLLTRPAHRVGQPFIRGVRRLDKY